MVVSDVVDSRWGYAPLARHQTRDHVLQFSACFTSQDFPDNKRLTASLSLATQP